MGITYEEYERQNDRGNTLHAVKYTPQSVARAGLVWHHGYGEHCGRYKTVFSALAESGIAVFAQDGFCFGKSERDPARISYIQQYQFLVDDLLALAEEAAAALPKGTPLFVGGQSMGGCMAVHAALQKPDLWTGLILSSAMIGVEMTPMLRLQSLVGGVLGRLVPRSRLVNAVRPEDMSEDPQVVKAYVEDPLTDVGNVRVHTALQLQQAMKTSTARHHELQMPIYAHHGTNDKCTSLPAVKRLLAAVSSKDKTLNEVPGGYHELLHGEGTLKMAQAMADWILARSEPAPAEQARTDAVPAAAAAAPVSSNL